MSGKEGVVTGVTIESVPVGIEVSLEATPQVDDRAIRREFKLEGESEKVDLAESAQGLRVGKPIELWKLGYHPGSR